MKFAEKLAAHITPEWNSQYIKYDEMKEFLYQYEQNAPIQDDEKLLQRYFARADETFFQFCDKELVKITIFFAEKLAEAKRKFEALKSELIDHTSTDRNRRQARSQRTQSVMEEIEEEEEEEDDKDKAAAAKETDLLRRRRSKRESSIAGESVAKPPSVASGAQTITQRLLEKNRERQAKKKLFRKAYDLKLAFSEFYLSLILLQNYQNLNFTGFKKILKKHDKIFKTSRGAEWYKANVEASTFFMDKTVDNLIAEVENLFTQYLENGDKERAMKRLRVPPFEEKQTPWTTFRLGLFIGMTCILFPVTLILLFMCYSKNHAFPFDWKVAIKLYRSTFLIILHIIFIGLNSYGWSRSGVNHVLIFEVDPRNHLTYQELLESGTFLGVFWFVSLISFLISAYYGVDLYIHPLGLVIFLTIYLINPLPKFYYSSRTWLMNVLWRVFCAPFYHVAFAHFWLADQLTSFDFLFNDVQFFTCWYIFENKWSPLKDIYSESPCKPRNNRDLSLSYNVIALLLMCMPSWIRFFQCLRRYRDTTNWFPHLVNAGKYSTTFLDIGTLSLKYHFSSMYSSDWENPFFYLWIIAKFFGTIYKLAWDYKMDWGFFDKNAGENRFLREVIVYSSKGYYYFAIIENFILRFIWLVRLYDIGLKGETYKEFVTTCLGFLEVFRRFVWNFFRLENEHLNNCGQFRAVRDISISPMQMTDLSSIEKMMDEEDGVINRQSTVIQQKTHQHNNQLTMTKRFINKHPNLMNITKRFNAFNANQQNDLVI